MVTPHGNKYGYTTWEYGNKCGCNGKEHPMVWQSTDWDDMDTKQAHKLHTSGGGGGGTITGWLGSGKGYGRGYQHHWKRIPASLEEDTSIIWFPILPSYHYPRDMPEKEIL